MRGEKFSDNLHKVSKPGTVSPDFPEDFGSSPKSEDVDDRQHCNGRIVSEFNEIVDSISNLNIVSHDVPISDNSLEQSPNSHSDEFTLEDSRTSSQSGTELGSPERSVSTYDSHFSTQRTSSLSDSLSSQSNLGSPAVNNDNSSNNSENIGSGLNTTSSKASGPVFAHNPSFQYFKENTPIQNYCNYTFTPGVIPSFEPLKFDIFTPNNKTNTKPNTKPKIKSNPVYQYKLMLDTNVDLTKPYPVPFEYTGFKDLEKYYEHQKETAYEKEENPESQSNEENVSEDTKSISTNRNDSFDSDDQGDHGANDGGLFGMNLSDTEDQKSYVPGGYHPVTIGEVYNDRYKIEAKLGWGYFSTVWLASDAKNKDTFVALKFQRSAKIYYNAVLDEIDLLKEINEGEETNAWMSTRQVYKKLLGQNYNPTKGVVSYIDYFKVEGPNGTHICVVFEAMGPNILTLIRLYQFQGIPMDLVKKITTHVLLGLDYLHRVCKIIHTDLKPENILVTSPLSNYDLNTCNNGKVAEKKNASEVNENNGNSTQGQVSSGAKADEGAEETQAHNEDKESNNEGASGDYKQNGDDEEITEIGANTDVEYVKNTIRPCFSDPTLTTTYKDNYALQETFLKMPYHHITWNMMRTVDRSSNKSHYHPSVLSSIGMNPYRINRTTVKTSKGYINIRPYTAEQFSHPNAIFKICDLGNACWTHKHFTEEIQTRQYRSPEAILKIGYDCLSDIWSLACVIFELITGDYLFDPNGNDSDQRDSSHIALIVELLGPIPNYMIKNSKKAKKMEFHNINKIKRWPLDSVLVKKYGMDKKEAKQLSNFLSCMLRINPLERHTAQQLLSHTWLTKAEN
ncbi:serine/threonine protein kinase [Theileria orientalis strain Shintoku]|uniref:non-specific serine/threonine protein kinase n=1 Tax=Theileria orientalis strain Shintoku TaxID=869250 RepID=J4C4B7_THEOR|nr:serine/threonine protein kinase [Theileria orientalis strain Shintoku]BAM41906.1 serine/threonine protein kinase [Theileria orientalis strain Shintoku]|eukprot:XP_009692207.1 serine/threonine protein kinase [Theileria orientalis strain Shintoku]